MQQTFFFQKSPFFLSKRLLNNINKFKVDVIKDKEKTDEILVIDRKGMWSVDKNNKKNDK